MGNSTKLEQWAQWAEIVASVAIVVSLVFLIQEVRYNSSIMERQAVLDRTEAFNAPFFQESPLPTILTKVKEADGLDPEEQAFVERYDLTYQEAVLWVRHLAVLWAVLEADYRVGGLTPELEAMVGGLLATPDNRLFWEQGAPLVTSPGFRAYVETVLESG